MLWIEKEECTACGICVEKCPVDCIEIAGGAANIDMDECISCAVCHGICPVDAVRHNSERVEFWTEEKVEKALKSRELCDELLGKGEGEKSLGRIINKYKMFGKILLDAAGRLEKIQDKEEE